jgi:hypothetical protein
MLKKLASDPCNSPVDGWPKRLKHLLINLAGRRSRSCQDESVAAGALPGGIKTITCQLCLGSGRIVVGQGAVCTEPAVKTSECPACHGQKSYENLIKF